MKIMKPIIIDNFLEEEPFNVLTDLICYRGEGKTAGASEFDWIYASYWEPGSGHKSLITDYFFTTSETANNNLIKSGIKKDNIFFCGS